MVNRIHESHGRRWRRAAAFAFPLLAWLLLGVLIAAPARANDLILEFFTLSDITVNGDSLLAEDPIYFLDGESPDFRAHFVIKVTWDCGTWQADDTCSEARPDTDFDITLRGQASGVHVPVAVSLPGTNIAYRNHGPTGTGVTVEQLFFDVPINDPGFTAFVTDRFVAGDLLEVRGRVDPSMTVPEDLPDTTNNRGLVNINSFAGLSGDVEFGPTSATLTDFDSVVVSPCGGPQSLNVVNADISWDPGAGFDPVSGLDQTLCVNWTFNGQTLDLVSNTAVDVGEITGMLGGFEITLVDNTLLPGSDPSGGGLGPGLLGLFTVELPDGLTYHLSDFYNKPLAAGARAMLFIAPDPAYASADDIEGNTALGYIASERLPFSIRNQNATLNSSGFTGNYDKVHYRFDMTFEPSDPRNNDLEGVISNDRRFSNPTLPGGGEPYSITPAGLQIGSIEFQPVDNARLHYPRTGADVENFDLDIIDNQVAASTALPAISYRFPLSGDCEGCDSGVDDPFVQIAPTTERMVADGSVTAYGTLNLDPAWGPEDSGGQRIFQRANDNGAQGVMYIPGWVAEGTGGGDNRRVVDWLMGSRDVVLDGAAPAPSTQYMVQDLDSVLGNYFFAGLNLGPQIYSDAGGQPQVGLGSDLSALGSSTTVGLGGLDTPFYQLFSSSIATKYVLRRAGVTGVFNTSGSFQPLVYGYNMDVNRFAWRQTVNTIDTENWFDGRVQIGGKGDFIMHFENLDMDCNGVLGAGLVVRDECDGMGLQRNCDERFLAWDTEVEFQSMAFVPDNPFASSCEVQDRELWVGNTMNFRALDEPLGIVGAWTPDGEVELISLTGDTDHVVDRPPGASGSDDQGLDVAFDGDGTLGTPNDGTTDGYLKAGALVGVPLWDALDVDVRLANSESAPDVYEAEPTLIIGEGAALGADDDNASNAALAPLLKDNSALSANYTWGASGFGFNLPVYYEPGRRDDGLAPRFLGLTQGADLVVLEANAGVDFISPDSTRLSFGASADFEALALASFDLSVDLSDPQSIESIDGFLCSPLGICSDPVATLVGDVQATVGALNGVFDAGFDGYLEAGIDLALDELTVGIDPFEVAADAVSLVQSVPEQFASIGISAFEELIIDMLVPLSVELDTSIKDVYLELPELLLAAEAGPIDVTLEADLAEAREKLAAGISALDEVIEVIDTTEVQVDQAVLAFDALINEVVNVQAQAAITALDDLQALIPNPIPTDVLCDAPDFDSPAFDGPALFEQLYQLSLILLDAETALKVTNFVDFATTVAVVTGVDTELAEAAQVIVDELTEEAELAINDALVVLEDVCDDLPSQDALAGVNVLFDELRDTVAAFETEVLTVRAALTVPDSGLFDKLLEDMHEVRGHVAGVRQYLEDLRQMTQDAEDGFPNGFQFSGLLAVEIRDAFDLYVLELTGQQYSWYYDATLFTTENTFIGEWSVDLRQPIDELIAQAGFASQLPLNGLIEVLPHPSSVDLKVTIRDLIMNSPVVEDFDVLVNVALTEAVSSVNDIALDVFDQLNFVVQDIVMQLETAANEALAKATAVIPDMPVNAASLDGYAVVQGNELERLHIGAEWTLAGDDDESTSTYGAALDVTSWASKANGSGCTTGDTSSVYDAVISAYGVPISVGLSDTSLKEVYLGFTMADNPGGSMAFAPAGLFGGLTIDGTIDFEALEIYDIAFAAGVSVPGSGVSQNYLGATASASFDSLSLQAAFLVGKTCDTTVLKSLDPQVAEFIETPGGVFNGVYARGSASIPIWNNGCLLTVGVSGDVGAWVLSGPPLTVGGLVGGGAWGKVACIASLRGQVTTLAQKSGDKFSFQGEGWGAAGAGFCEPEKWTSVPKSRDDGGCGTGDASFKATFDNGWDIGAPKPSAIH